MGKCILLENDMFHTGLGLSKRKGSSVDRALIIDAFHRLGFQVFHADYNADADAVTEAGADDLSAYASTNHQQKLILLPMLMPIQIYTRWRSTADETKC